MPTIAKNRRGKDTVELRDVRPSSEDTTIAVQKNVEESLQRFSTLKQAALAFVLDAEGELATALEQFVAEQLARAQAKDAQQQSLAVVTFLTHGLVSAKTPLEWFMAETPALSEADRQMLTTWRRNFTGLFTLQQASPAGVKLLNWLTAKSYWIKPSDPAVLEAMQRFKPGEILLARIAPLTEQDWTLFSGYVQLGNLGKPKLAVAIGHFKQAHPTQLYGDAPELLETAWQSVERYHQDFLDFFGGAEVTLSGYELTKKMTEFQEFVTQRRFQEAGLNRSQSLADLAQASGVDDDELTELATTLGMDAETAAQMIHNPAIAKMVTPQVELPPELKRAEQLTLLAHPRWGQILLSDQVQWQQVLQAQDWRSVKGAEALVRKSLETPAMNTLAWQRLAQGNPADLERVLREFLQRPEFILSSDLAPLLQTYHKPLEPVLPDIASVPIHLHNLFQDALAEVNKTKTKDKGPKKVAKGFNK